MSKCIENSMEIMHIDVKVRFLLTKVFKTLTQLLKHHYHSLRYVLSSRPQLIKYKNKTNYIVVTRLFPRFTHPTCFRLCSHCLLFMVLSVILKSPCVYCVFGLTTHYQTEPCMNVEWAQTAHRIVSQAYSNLILFSCCRSS